MPQIPSVGDVVAGKYVIESLLGQGGMGAVFVARHRVTGKRLALKVLLPEVSDATGSERFLREAQAAGGIHHRNVVDVYDIGSDHGGLYMVMELLDGKPLSELLQDESMTLQQALLVLARAMDGVSAAHAVGVIHRDLKPDNVFVCYGSSGELDDPRVLDFGISKASGPAVGLTQTGAMLGTPYYMSFEQINAQPDLDARVDIYAMGVILYEAMAGQRPYESEALGALALRISEGQAVPLHQLRPDVPVALCDVVMKAMARDRQDRYPTMDALSDAVQPFIPRTGELAIPADQALPLRTPPASASMRQSAFPAHQAHTPGPQAFATSSRERSRKVWWLAPALVAAGVGAWWWARPEPSPTQSTAGGAAAVSSAPGAQAPAPLPEPLPDAEAHKLEPSPQTFAEDAAEDAAEPADTGSRGGEPAEARAEPAPVAKRHKAKRSTSAADKRSRRRRARAAARDPSTEPSPSATSAAPAKAPAPKKAPAAKQAVEVEGRAGRMGLDDF